MRDGRSGPKCTHAICARCSQTAQNPGKSMTQAADSREERLEDVAIAAGVLAQAVQDAPDRALETVDTPCTTADVVLDDQAADVVLHYDGVTIHLRR